MKLINKIKNYHPSKWEALSFLLIPIFIGILTSICGGNNDIWFILNLGRYILNNGFPTIDPFTIHEGLEIVVQQWLADIIFYKGYELLDKTGIYLIVNLVNAYIIFITYKLLMLVTDNKRNLSVLFTTISTTLISFTFIMARPQIFSTSILLTELYVLEKYLKTNNYKILFLLPLLSVLMINLHASMWLLLFCFWLPFFISRFKFKLGRIESAGGKKKELLIAVLFMFLVGFINPYGIKSMTYVLTSYNVPVINELVGEMKVPDIHTMYGKGNLLTILLVYISYIFLSKLNIKTHHFLLLLGTTYLALSSNRGILFFIIASIYPLSFYLKDKFHIIKEAKNNTKMKLLFAIASIILVIMPSIFVIKNNYIKLELSTNQGIDYLKKNDDIKKISLYCSYGECTYAQYLGIKVYMDSRAEIFLKVNNGKEDILNEFYLLQERGIYYKDFLEKYDFTHLLVKETDILYQSLLHDDNYEIMYQGYESKVDYKLGAASDDLYNYIIFKKVK